MLNVRGVLSGMLGIFFVLSFSGITLGQTNLSDSEIIKEINASERRTRDHVDAKFEGIDTKIGNLNTNVAVNTTNIANMSKDINELKGTVTWIWRGILGIFVTLIISVAGYFIRLWSQNRFNQDSEIAVSTKNVRSNLSNGKTGNIPPDYQRAKDVA